MGLTVLIATGGLRLEIQGGAVHHVSNDKQFFRFNSLLDSLSDRRASLTAA